MSYGKKSWQEKLMDRKGLPKILRLEKRFPCYRAVQKMGVEAGDEVVLVNPSEVVEMMRNVPEGKLTTIVEICKGLAQKHGVKGCCSLTSGIYIMIAANAAEEAARQGNDLKIPYWRTLKAGGFLNEKYPNGAKAQRMKLENEGFTVLQRGKRLFVEDYRNFLAYKV